MWNLLALRCVMYLHSVAAGDWMGSEAGAPAINYPTGWFEFKPADPLSWRHRPIR